MSTKAIEFAAEIGASVVLPSDPKRERNLFAKTDVTKTWEFFGWYPHGPEIDFDKPGARQLAREKHQRGTQ